MENNLNATELNQKLVNTKKEIDNLVQKRYSAIAEIKVCQNSVQSIVEEIKGLGVDPKHVGDAITKINEEINENLQELNKIDEVLSKYKELDISTVKDMQELESLNFNQEF